MEREPNENSNERMSDRPNRDEERVDESERSVDDTGQEPGESLPVDDV